MGAPVEVASGVEIAAPLRAELLAHCYRLLGSLADAEERVAETVARVQASAGAPDPKELRALLYKVATVGCLAALADRPRRALPQMLAPSSEAGDPLGAPLDAGVWLEPFPDALLADGDAGAEARAAARANLALPLVAALQQLPPRQRAILILREILGWQPGEIAETLGTTGSAVSSALHRARATLERTDPALRRPPAPLDEDARRALLANWVRAFEAGDPAAIAALLREDASLAHPPLPTWWRGRAAVEAALAGPLFAPLFAGGGRLVETAANGGPAFAVWAGGRPHSIQLLRLEPDGVSDCVLFADPSLFARFGF